MQVLHLTVDLYRCRCDPAWLGEPGPLRAWCLDALAAAGLPPLGELFLAQPGPGVAGVVLLAEGQLVLRTRADECAALLDLQLSLPEPPGARALLASLVAAFAPEWTEQRSLDRGEEQ